MIFQMHPSGLYTYDLDGKLLCFVMKVNGNKVHFTKRQLGQAERAWSLNVSLGFQSEWILKSNQIKDCPVTIDDADIVTKIWGCNLWMLKEKTTQRTQSIVELDIVWIPPEIRKLLSLSIDIFFVNFIPFLIFLSSSTKHLAEFCTTTIFKALWGIVLYYF